MLVVADQDNISASLELLERHCKKGFFEVVRIVEEVDYTVGSSFLALGPRVSECIKVNLRVVVPNKGTRIKTHSLRFPELIPQVLEYLLPDLYEECSVRRCRSGSLVAVSISSAALGLMAARRPSTVSI